MQPSIVWEKWQSAVELAEEMQEDSSLEGGYEDGYSPVHTMPTGVPIIFTNKGPVPLNNVATNFNYWLMHTNFRLTSEILDVIEPVNGVEFIDVLSHYRARIAFGILFEAPLVKKDIQDQIFSFFSKDELMERAPKAIISVESERRIAELKEKLAKESEYWTIYLLPNGEIESSIHTTVEELKEQANILEFSQANVGGFFCCSVSFEVP